jgi:hypothetical protein
MGTGLKGWYLLWSKLLIVLYLTLMLKIQQILMALCAFSAGAQYDGRSPVVASPADPRAQSHL